MPRDPFPDREGDGQEPEGWPEDDWDPEAAMDARIAAVDAGRYEVPPEGAVQGLFVCLPAEDTDVAGFAQDGAMETTLPGPLLAAAVHAITGEDGQGLAALSDDQLIGVIGAARRMEARTAWTQMVAVREFAARRPASRDRGQQPGGSEGAAFSIFAADELSFAFHLTWQSAQSQIVYACAVADRLPQTFAALAAGRIHPVHVRIIEDLTRVLTEADAARADVILAAAAQSKTFGELRAAAHRLVLRLDPDAARRRKEAARKEAHVRRFREDSGNAGMIARELPSDEVLASWQHVDQRAHDLRAAGMPGTLRELRVQAYLDLLQERDSRAGLGGPSGPPDGNGDGGRGGSGVSGPGRDGGPGSGLAGRQDPGPSLAAQVTITVPAGTLLGWDELPGEVDGFGLLDAPATRDLVAAAARHPDTRWCVTALHPDGTAAAHGCAPGRHLLPQGRAGPGPPEDQARDLRRTSPPGWPRSPEATAITPAPRPATYPPPIIHPGHTYVRDATLLLTSTTYSPAADSRTSARDDPGRTWVPVSRIWSLRRIRSSRQRDSLMLLLQAQTPRRTVAPPARAADAALPSTGDHERADLTLRRMRSPSHCAEDRVSPPRWLRRHPRRRRGLRRPLRRARWYPRGACAPAVPMASAAGCRSRNRRRGPALQARPRKSPCHRPQRRRAPERFAAPACPRRAIPRVHPTGVPSSPRRPRHRVPGRVSRRCSR
jgi:hypothetical protein